MLWLTKSRMEWLTKGERNTSFFHRSVQIKRQKSRILSLDNSVGETITNPKILSDHIRDFFCNLLASESPVCTRNSNSSAHLHQSLSFCHPPTIGEVKNALFSMQPLKAPGPDGFHPLFFQNTWNFTHVDLHQNISNWFASATIPNDLCNALICLIPKGNNPSSVKQLRPISLCNTIKWLRR